MPEIIEEIDWEDDVCAIPNTEIIRIRSIESLFMRFVFLNAISLRSVDHTVAGVVERRAHLGDVLVVAGLDLNADEAAVD